MDTEFCGTLTEGETSHRDGFCDRKEWPTPFLWIDYMGQSMLLSYLRIQLNPGYKPWAYTILQGVLGRLIFRGRGEEGLVSL